MAGSDLSEKHGRPFVGFYWTLPVPAVGFTDLPQGVEEAVKASRTIHYQRERVRRWVESEGGHLAAEFAFMEEQPDRGSPGIEALFTKALATARRLRAEVAVVRFWDYLNARLHRHLRSLLYEHADLCVLLPPDPDFPCRFPAQQGFRQRPFRTCLHPPSRTA